MTCDCPTMLGSARCRRPFCWARDCGNCHICRWVGSDKPIPPPMDAAEYERFVVVLEEL